MELQGVIQSPSKYFSAATLDAGNVRYSELEEPSIPLKAFLALPLSRRQELEEELSNCILFGWVDSYLTRVAECPFVPWADGILYVRRIRTDTIDWIGVDPPGALYGQIAWARNIISLATLVNQLEDNGGDPHEILEWVDIGGQLSYQATDLGEGVGLYYNEAGGLLGMYDVARNILVLPGIAPDPGVQKVSVPTALLNFARKVVRPFPPKKAPGKRKIDRTAVRIGADIEAVVVDEDSIVHSPIEFVPDTQDGQIGTDGNVELLEIRPEEAPTPEELVENTRILLENLVYLLPEGYDIRGGGGGDYRSSTGLHIHFSGISTDLRPNRRGADPAILVRWLDVLLTTPIEGLPGSRRETDRYGKRGDYRNRGNHNHFPHNGFEWRVLPSMLGDKRLYDAVLKIAYCIMLTFEEVQSYTFNEKEFTAAWYTGLVDAPKYAEEISYFVDWCNSFKNINLPVLSTWFGKRGDKDRECDTVVRFANDEDAYLAITEFVAYNPAKLFDTVVVWASPSGKGILFSQIQPKLKEYILGTYGISVQVKAPSEALQRKYRNGRTFYLGIGRQVLAKLRANSVGSRNRIRMFVQDLIKHI